MCLQERCGVEQLHIGPYLEGHGGPPVMAANDPQATFLKETQQWITKEEQVSCLHILWSVSTLLQAIKYRRRKSGPKIVTVHHLGLSRNAYSVFQKLSSGKQVIHKVVYESVV